MKLNEFMLNKFMRMRDIIVNLWPHRLVSDRILAGTLVDFCDVINVFEFGVFLSFDVLNIFKFSIPFY